MHAKYRTRPRARCTCPQRTPVACAQRLSDGTRDPMAHAHGAQLSCDCLSHSPPHPLQLRPQLRVPTLRPLPSQLASQQANFERDVGRLRKQYERRGRALRAARVARLADE